MFVMRHNLARRWVRWAVPCAIAGILLTIFYFERHRSAIQADPEGGIARQHFEVVEETDATAVSKTPFAASVRQLLDDEALTEAEEFFHPERVIGNPDCRLDVSRDTGVVLLPDGEGARFAAVNADGILHSGRLGFRPARFDVVKRRDGTLLTAFGDLERTEPGRPGHEALWPVSVYVDGQPVYEHDDTWRFEIAPDGSSYYVVEPLAGDTSRLRIRNLDEGSERTYDIGGLASSYPSGAVSHVDWYTQDFSEVHFYPTHDGVGWHHFYPVGGERREPRSILVDWKVPEGEPRTDSALFLSSEVGFMAYSNSMDGFTLMRIEQDWSAAGRAAVPVWERYLERPGALPYSMSVSRDGSLLLVVGWVVRLIDTATGETRFAMPTVDKEAQLARLRGVLGTDAGVEMVGTVTLEEFIGGELYIGRRFTLERNGFEGRAVDVYDLDGIEIDSAPTKRISYPANTPPCSPQAVHQRLRGRDGRLVFGERS